MSVTTIADTRVKVKPSRELIELIGKNLSHVTEITKNVAKVLKSNGYSISTGVTILTDEFQIKRETINKDMVSKIVTDIKVVSVEESKQNISKNEEKAENVVEPDDNSISDFFYLTDLNWINNLLIDLREKDETKYFLNDLLRTCEVILPENEIIPRNPELEARCQKLRTQQENLEYQKITKNVDSIRQKYPEDTISYQIKAINKQLVAVFQFVVSVVTGFVFGFWGLPLIFGTLKFGLRLILGIIFALIIALAEMYFLAVKLNEYDNAVDASNNKNLKPKRKVHAD